MVSADINWQNNPVCPKCGSPDVDLAPPIEGDRMIVSGDNVCASCGYRSPAEGEEWFPVESPDDDD